MRGAAHTHSALNMQVGVNKGSRREIEEHGFEEREVPGRVLLKRVLEERDVAGGATGVLFLFVALLHFACRSRFVRRLSVFGTRARSHSWNKSVALCSLHRAE